LITIVTSAIRAKDGTVYFDPELRPKRHPDVILLMVQAGLPTPVTKDATQGFLTSEGRFVDRIEAAGIALAAGQIAQLRWGEELFSEDLWHGNLSDQA